MLMLNRSRNQGKKMEMNRTEMLLSVNNGQKLEETLLATCEMNMEVDQ